MSYRMMNRHSNRRFLRYGTAILLSRTYQCLPITDAAVRRYPRRDGERNREGRTQNQDPSKMNDEELDRKRGERLRVRIRLFSL
jgi:hypothetical protein